MGFLCPYGTPHFLRKMYNEYVHFYQIISKKFIWYHKYIILTPYRIYDIMEKSQFANLCRTAFICTLLV